MNASWPTRLLEPIRKHLRRKPRRPTSRPMLEMLEDRCLLATFTVINTADSGQGSLRQAILDANANAGADIIAFNMAANDAQHIYYRNDGAAGKVTTANIAVTAAADDTTITDIDPDWAHSWWSIRPNSGLPSITQQVTIDGYTQPGALKNSIPLADRFGVKIVQGTNAILRLELDGSGAGFVGGLDVRGASTVRGLVVNRFLVAGQFTGAVFVTGNNNAIEGNFIGTDVSGTLDLGNAGDGVATWDASSGSRIGGTDASDGTTDNIVQWANLISGNNSSGVYLNPTTNNNIVQGNLIGTDASGRRALGNSVSVAYPGVGVEASGNLIGGTDPGAGNVISGNAGSGIVVGGSSNTVRGNFIGTDVTGMAALPNGRIDRPGINLFGLGSNTIGGTIPAARNVISGNAGAGISVNPGVNMPSQGNVMQGNYIGTAADGLAPRGNGTHGIEFGGSLNVFAPNNLIGSDAMVVDGRVPGGNVIAFNGGYGIVYGGPGNRVLGNSIHDNVLVGIRWEDPARFPVAPVVTSVATASGTTTVQGTYRADANTRYRIEFFANNGPDPTGFGEGQFFLGFTTATADGAGNVSFTANLPVTLLPEQTVTATSTRMVVEPAHVGRWTGDGHPNDVIRGNNGTLIGGATYAAGMVGQAFSFDGSGDAVDVGNPASLQLQTFTIDAWVKRGSTSRVTLESGTGGHIFGYGRNGYVLGLMDPEGGVPSSAGELFLSKAGVDYVASGPLLRITDTQWHHVAVTKSAGMVVFYLDSVPSSPISYDPGFSFTSNAAIGAINFDGAYRGSFLGSIDEVAVYSRALSAAEISASFNAGSAGTRLSPLFVPTGETSEFSGNITSLNCIPGHVAWWPGDRHTGDIIGSNNGTVVNGATYAPGMVGQAFSFDGVDDAVSTPLTVSYGSGATFDLWLKTTDLTNGIVMGDGGGFSTHRGMAFFLQTGVDAGKIVLVGNHGVFGEFNFFIIGPVIADGLFHHVAGTWTGDTTPDGVKLYVDGVLAGTATALAPITTGSTPINLGGHTTIAHNKYAGLIDEADVFTRALSAAEIQAIYNAGSAGKCRNHEPSAVADSYSVDEDATLTVVAPGVLANDSDPDANPLTAVLVTGPANGALELHPDGSFTYTPNANFNVNDGFDTFTYRANDGTHDSEPAVVSITVNPVNDAPSFTKGADQTVVEDAGAQTVAGWASNLSAGPPDEAGQTLTFQVTTDNPSLFAVLPALSADGTLTSTPAPDASGMTTVTVTLMDGGGRDNGGVDTSAPQTFAITITAVNDGPRAGDDSYPTDEDVTLTVPAPGVLQNDSDPDGDPLTAQLVTPPAHGTLTLNADGSFTYMPNLNFNGTDSFTYTASDSSATSNAAMVTLTVNPVNDPPVAVEDAYVTDEDSPLDVAAPGVLANDSDVDGNALTAVLVSGPTNGVLNLNADGSFTYTPAANYNGQDSFTYRASDARLQSDTATVTLTVNSVNDPPEARPDAYSIGEDGILTVAAPGVLVNDTDLEGDVLSAVLVTEPANGRLTLNSDGSFTYRPNLDFNGTDSFSYKANDGDDSNTVTVTLTVHGINDAPEANGDAYSMDEDGTLDVPAPGVLANTATWTATCSQQSSRASPRAVASCSVPTARSPTRPAAISTAPTASPTRPATTPPQIPVSPR